MRFFGQSWIRKILGARRTGMSSMAWLSKGGSIPVRQTQLAPDGLEFSGDVSQARWIEESLSEWQMGEGGCDDARELSRLRSYLSPSLSW